MSQFSEDMHAECEKEVQELQDLLEEFEKSDRQKTNEINVLVKEHRALIDSIRGIANRIADYADDREAYDFATEIRELIGPPPKDINAGEPK